MRTIFSLRAFTGILLMSCAAFGIADVEGCTPFGAADEPVSNDAAAQDAATQDADASATGKPQDGGADATEPVSKAAKLTFVNATVSLGANGDFYPGSNAMRLCLSRGESGELTDGFATFPPLPHRVPSGSPNTLPGFFNGTGAVLPALALDLEPRFVKPYIMNAKSLATKGITGAGEGKSCEDILRTGSPSALVENVDYWSLPLIAPHTFKVEKSFLLVLTGCANDVDTPQAANCGPGKPAGGGAPGVGNLKVSIYEVDRSTKIDGDSMGVQVIHASSPFNTDPGPTSLGVFPALRESANGTASPLSGGKIVPYLAHTELVQVKGLKPFITPNPNGADTLSFPLDKVKELSFVADDYALGKAYTFVLVGDRNISAVNDGGTPRTEGYHFLGFPNDPTIKAFEP